jgi:hypothetical protein
MKWLHVSVASKNHLQAKHLTLPYLNTSILNVTHW